MARTVQKRKVVGNPGVSAYGRPGRATRNPGEIVGFTLAGNPGRKGHSMAKTKKAASRGYAKSKYKKSHKGNPGRAHKSKYSAHRRRRGNPGGMASGIGSQVTNAVFVIVGALGSKVGAQVVLGAKNTGLLGYAANAGAGGLLWFLTEKVMRNRAASSGVIAGTIVQIVLRAINDYTPFGSYVAQLGMGDYQMQSFVTPQVLVDPWRSAEIAIPSGWGAPPAPRMLAAAAAPSPMANGNGAPAAGMAGLYGGGGGFGGGLYSV